MFRFKIFAGTSIGKGKQLDRVTQQPFQPLLPLLHLPTRGRVIHPRENGMAMRVPTNFHA